MKNISIALFALAAFALLYGVYENFTDMNGHLGGTGTMSHNGYYQLSIALAALATAAELIFSQRAA